MARITPTQRTLKLLRKMGRRVDIAERWVRNPKHPAGGVRKDLFGIIDIIALDPKRGVVGIQSCGTDFSAHYTKLTGEKREETEAWLKTPGTSLELWGWRKVKKKRGGKQKIWQPRIQQITIDNLE